MATLEVRVYNVGFGDAVLLSIPERSGQRTVTRHLLIDVGNVLGTEGGRDAVFKPAFEDILARLDGRPVDLYVMTHEHLDHVQGPLYAATKLGLRLEVRYSWLTASAEPGYYDRHPEAKKKRLALVEAYDQVGQYLAAAPEVEPHFQTLMRNNDALAPEGSASSTKDCVDFLRTLAPETRTSYVHRQSKLGRRHPFREARLSVWAPEEDTSVYYGRFQPMAMGVVVPTAGTQPRLAQPVPPPGVDAGAFSDLVDARRRGFVENLLSIDKAANNTSLVVCVEWRGWRLLFPGDAEERSWKTMSKLGVLQPVHFLKVGHHGSHNGTPEPEILDAILPPKAPDRRPRHAAVSTATGSYNNVPDTATLALVEERCELRSTTGLVDGEPLLFQFPGR